MDEDKLQEFVHRSRLEKEAAAQIEITFTTADEALGALRREFINVFAEFGSSVAFIIDGDALLQYSMQSKTVDWSNGGQPLHICYLFQSMLDRLNTRKARFRVLFSTGNKNVFTGVKAAIRAAIIANLKHNTDFPLDEFDVNEPGAWKNYCDLHLPSFVFTDFQWESNDSDADAASIAELTYATKTLALLSMVHHVPVVLVDGLEFQGSVVGSFVLRIFNQTEVAAALEMLQATPVTSKPLNLPEISGIEEMAKSAPLSELGYREVMWSAVLKDVLKANSSPEFEELARVFLLHLILLRTLPLNKRSIAVPDSFPASGLFSTAGKFFDALWAPLCTAIGTVDGLESGKYSLKLTDLWDGRLFHMLLLSLYRSEGKKASIVDLVDSNAQKALKSLVDATGISPDLKLVASKPSAEDKKLYDQAWSAVEAITEKHKALPKALLPLDAKSSIMNDVVPDVMEQLKPYESRDEQVAAATELQKRGQLKESYIWQESNILREEDHFFRGRNVDVVEDDSDQERIERLAYLSTKLNGMEGNQIRPARWNKDDPKGGPQLLKEFLKLCPKKTAKDISEALKKEDYKSVKILLARYYKQRSDFSAKSKQRFQSYLAAFAQSLIGGPIQTQNIFLNDTDKNQKKATSRQQQENLAKQRNKVPLNNNDVVLIKNWLSKQSADIAKQERDIVVVTNVVNKALAEANPNRFDLLSADSELKVAGFLKAIRKIENNKCAKLDEVTRSVAQLGAKSKKKGKAAAKSALQVEAEQILKEVKDMDPEHKLSLLSLKARMCGFKLILKSWKMKLDTFTVQEEQWTAGKVLNEALEIVEKFPAEPEARMALKEALCELGFPEAGSKICDEGELVNPLIDRKGLSIHSFQMQFMGPHFPRPKGKQDNRVVHFDPDDWQRELLDTVDAKQSALISAPTSSGKTFISYYAIEQVLRESHDGVVVYVSPTKALVNQFEAEIYARFNKDYKGTGKVLCGVFTSDFRHDELNCQVLVTVPDCLEILYLSSKYPEWASRVKYVIFDEVHCVSMEGGEVWERLLLMIYCPFLALSASIGNADEFEEWLDKIETKRGRSLKVIKHKQRYNDLSTFVVSGSEVIPLNPIATVSVKRIQAEGFPPELKLLPEHCDELYRDLVDLLPDDLQTKFKLKELSPQGGAFFSDKFRISMKHAVQYEQELRKVFLHVVESNPEIAQAIIDKADARIGKIEDTPINKYWEGDRLAKTLRQLEVGTAQSGNMLPVIIFNLNTTECDKLRDNLVESLKLGQYTEELKKFTDGGKKYNDWKEASDALAKSKQKEISEIIKANEKAAKAMKSQEKSKNADEPVDTQQDAPNAISYEHLEDNWVNPDFSFGKPLSDEDIKEAFAGKYRYLGPEDETFLEGLRRGIGVHHNDINKHKRGAVEKLFRKKKLQVVIATDTLALGINMPCRTVVIAGNSTLLDAQNYHQMAGRAGRRGFDKRGNVVFMGLPQQKVRFLFNSELRALTGNVPLTTALALRLSIYRDLSHSEDCIDKKNALESIQRLVTMPFFSSGGEYLARQTKFNLRFCCEFLTREGLLRSEVDEAQEAVSEEAEKTETKEKDEDTPDAWDEEEEDDKNEADAPDDWDADSDEDEEEAKPEEEEVVVHAPTGDIVKSALPASTASLASLLFYLEPSNFAFVRFLNAGLFEATVAKHKDNPDELVDVLMTVMAHIFHTIRLHPSQLERIPANCNSAVVLPPLPKAYADELERYNRDTNSLYGTFIRVVAEETKGELKKHQQLPGNKKTEPFNVYASTNMDASDILSQLDKAAIPLVARSPFAAFNNTGDLFEDEYDYQQSLRTDLAYERAVVPSCNPSSDSKTHVSGQVYYNAYALDFMRRRNRAELLKFNGISSDEEYDVLRQFGRTLAVVRDALLRRVEELAPKGVEPKEEDFANKTAFEKAEKSFKARQDVADAFESLANKYGDAFREAFQVW